MTCKHCGASYDAGAHFCPECGERISQLEPVFSSDTQQIKAPAWHGVATVGGTMKKAGTASRKILHNRVARWVALILAAVVIVGGVIAVVAIPSDEEQIVGRLNDFAASYNEGDLDGMIDCLTPEDQQAMESAMQMGSLLGSELFGLNTDVQEILGTVMGFSQSTPGLQTTMYIKVYEISIPSDTRASADIAMCYGGIEDRGSISMQKVDGTWYIKG
ncbi:MAG: zinc ribbon domain-containing protein [Clostridia bacterium]